MNPVSDDHHIKSISEIRTARGPFRFRLNSDGSTSQLLQELEGKQTRPNKAPAHHPLSSYPSTLGLDKAGLS
jgi:hypothetical protein